MKKLSVMFVALMAVVTIHANVVDTLTAVSTGIKNASKKSYLAVNCSMASGAEYEVYAYGQQDFIQIRTTNNNSGVVSTTSGGYVKSVQIVQNKEKGTKQVDIYGSNTAFASPADLFNAEKCTKLGSVTQLDQTLTLKENYTYIGVRSSSSAVYLDKIVIEWTDTKPGGDPVVWNPDTISVDSAITLIGKGDVHTHYVKGVVAGTPFTVLSGGTKYCVWLTDINNPADSLEGFGIQKVQGTEYKDLQEMEQDFGLMDTVMVFANALSYFEKDKINEINGGYFFKTIGKSSTVNVTDIYKYGVGAVEIDPVKEGKYAYEVVLSSVENALHMVVTPSVEKSIEGSYSLSAESSYADNGGPISGSLRLTYVSTDGTNNTYHVVATYTLNGKTYHIDANYVLPGYTKEFEPFSLENDTPYEAKEGEVLTGLQALRFAKFLGGEGKESSITVSIHGYVADKPKIESGNQVDFDIKDNADLTGIAYAKAYLCYEQDLDSILKGDEVYVTGKVQLYGGQAEISNGTITRINEGPKHYRDLPCVEIPDNYISVERAMEIGNALQAEVGKTVETDEVYTVVGYVAKVTYQMAKDTASWFLSDDKESTFGDLQAYKCNIKAPLAHGDCVMITGKIAKYQKSETTANIEFARGTAQFICHLDKNTYTILTAVNDDRRGMVQGGKSASYLEKITLTAIANDGYHFTQWNDGNTDNPRIVVITQDTTFTAEFAKNQYLISVEAEHGKVNGSGYYEYLSSAQISATADEHYHFVKWSDGNTSNPRTISVTGNKTYTAIFAIDQHSVSAMADHGNVSGIGTYNYGSEISLTVTPSYGYQFTQWNDGNIDNPRSFIVTQDTTFIAQIDTAFSGQCGDDLTWKYNNGVLVISGTGAMYDYTQGSAPWMLFFQESISSLVINNGCTSIGNFAFYGLSNKNLKTIDIPNSVEQIGQYAFANCEYVKNLYLGLSLEKISANAFANDERLIYITCYAIEPPLLDESAFVNYDAYLSVPCESQADYKVSKGWKLFNKENISCIGAEETPIATDDVIVSPEDDKATLVWPADDQAAGYSIEISKDGVVFCTLHFNAQGQLIGIAFAPSRGGELRMMQAAEMTAKGWQFTVTGLTPGSKYVYTVDVVNAQQQSIKQYTGEFTTTGGISTDWNQLTDSPVDRFTKIIKDNHLLIFHNGKTYNAAGVEL